MRNFEAAKKDRHKLAYPNNKIDIACIDKDNELSQEEIIAAISSYKKSKKSETDENKIGWWKSQVFLLWLFW